MLISYFNVLIKEVLIPRVDLCDTYMYIWGPDERQSGFHF